ncbi:hypothetical protein EJ04DRAFT_490594 [Polyplosphaeria fusca]|uniref:Zn(2)-C6 fungal-type domain-containing protein n=1 Tax=Polyplosphaeria fusca TaxID=682080 RepID=A0A9P4R372_9PLEO|nr:hypothetical protein EJ04DRAFT_490594 [Polyplosphaeria fusca]
MVFRGKPSKSCARCRQRKLRCDLRYPCSPCTRAGYQCYGYRDTSSLRIADETKIMHEKAEAKRTRITSIGPIPKALSISLEIQARNLFFAYYVSDFSRTWDFLLPFFISSSAPEHLSLSIDAASLAFFHRQGQSPSALALSQHKYVTALRKAGEALRNPETAVSETMLDTSLVLDLYECISNASTNDANRVHVNGALTLVKLSGVNAYKKTSFLSALMRLVMNSIIISASKAKPIPPEVHTIREHAAGQANVNVNDPKWKLNGLSMDLTLSLASIQRKEMNDEDTIQICQRGDQDLETLDVEMPPHWQYDRVRLPRPSGNERCFESYFDIYPDRRITQTRNVIRFSRILLSEEILLRCEDKTDERSISSSIQAQHVIASMVNDILASVPQMTDCSSAAAYKLPQNHSTSSPHHQHNLSHYLDVYILIFPMYVAAWSVHCPAAAREWIIKELEYMAEHFAIKEAKMVKEILKTPDRRIGVWQIYRLLGSCAFAA